METEGDAGRLSPRREAYPVSDRSAGFGPLFFRSAAGACPVVSQFGLEGGVGRWKKGLGILRAPDNADARE